MSDPVPGMVVLSMFIFMLYVWADFEISFASLRFESREINTLYQDNFGDFYKIKNKLKFFKRGYVMNQIFDPGNIKVSYRMFSIDDKSLSLQEGNFETKVERNKLEKTRFLRRGNFVVEGFLDFLYFQN